MRYRKSRATEGVPKQVTVSLSAGKWYVSIQTEREVPEPVHPLQTAVGIDMGIARFATLSDGSSLRPLHSFRKHEKKLAALQRKMAKRVKFSANWRKLKARIQRLHRKIANVRNDFLHKATTSISKNHALVVIEDLKVRNMSRSASGTLDHPGKNVRVKAGLNKSILDQGWFEFRRQLAYKMEQRGGELIVANRWYPSSKLCRFCHNKNEELTLSDRKWVCPYCGRQIADRDLNAALNLYHYEESWGFESTSVRKDSSESSPDLAPPVVACRQGELVGGSSSPGTTASTDEEAALLQSHPEVTALQRLGKKTQLLSASELQLSSNS